MMNVLLALAGCASSGVVMDTDDGQDAEAGDAVED